MTRKFEPTDAGMDAGLRRVRLLRDAGRLQEARQAGEQVHKAHPRAKAVQNLLGSILIDLEDWERAAQVLRESLRLDAQQPMTLARLGKALLKLDKPRQALSSCSQAIALRPELAEAHADRARALVNLGRVDEGLKAFEDAARRFPDSADVHHEHGRALRKSARFDEAESALDTALHLRPDYPQSLVVKGLLLAERGDVERALACARRAVALAPEKANSKPALSEILLLAGEYTEAWAIEESRRDLAPGRRNPDIQKIPLWDGMTPLAGKSLLIPPEIGLGDYLMFARYVPLARELGAEPVLVAPAPLVPLLRSLDGSPVIVPQGSPVPAADLRCPVMSLARMFRTTLQTIPVRFPYLHADPAKSEQWGERLGARTRPRVGLAWSGKHGRGIDTILQRRRTVDVAALAPLLSLPLEFHSLQKEYLPQDAQRLALQASVRDHSTALADFSDTAALASHMDLVLSIDTSVAHMAGALALPLWVMLPFFSDYRWSPRLPTSPWYPDARLFRQPSPGDWDTVAGSVAAALHERFLR